MLKSVWQVELYLNANDQLSNQSIYNKGTTTDTSQKRGILMEKWASFKNIMSLQPIDEIKDYFGIKFALYFAWIGFYTYMLFFASIFGVLSIVYGLLTQEKNILAKEVCDENGNIIMCPQCDKYCDYYNITDACWFYKIRYVFDNNATYIFSFIMSVWSAVYLKLWKRYSAEITHRWGLTGFLLYEEHPRPNYKEYPRLNFKSFIKSTIKYSAVKPMKSKVSYWTVKLPCVIFSYSLALLGMMLVLIFVFSLILYSMYCRSKSFVYTKNKYHEIFFIPITTAIINFIVIYILNTIYCRVAVWLTNLEYQRTQIQFDNSLQLKIYLFQFVNYYSPVFYIAFLKGKFIGTPGKYIRIFGMRQEECDLGGCLLEVTIQIAIFMFCEQLFNNFLEFIGSHLAIFRRSIDKKNKSFYQTCKQLFQGICGKLDKQQQQYPRWLEDRKLIPWDNELFDEYLEMVIQYGFVTIFATAFPLAPLLALFNNFFIEIHFDAKKFIQYYRRPIAQRVPDIGIWFYIMKIIAKISIITNASIIASTTNLIPMFLYKLQNDWEAKGFLNHSMSFFNVFKFENGTAPMNSISNVTVCRYHEFRDEHFKRTFEYWHILVGKLIFVILYQNLVSFVVLIILWIIPDIPTKLKIKIKKEDRLLSEELLKDYEKIH